MKCKMCLYLTVIMLLFCQFAKANSDSFMQWHSTNIQLLRGVDYKLGSEQRTIMTFEHVNGWKYGDFFVFADQIWSDRGNSSYYLEPTLRFSLSKLSGKNLSYGIVKDLLISAQLEKTKGQGARRLAGVAVDFDLPGFRFFKTNFFVRDNPDLSGSTYQTTLVWNAPFDIGGTTFLLEGFADLAGSEGTTAAHQLIVPRFLMDAGHLVGIKENKLWIGMEWQYWHNKFGVDGVTESVAQLQLKYLL